jgi:DNA topoisomerase VI subunit B
MSVQLEFVQEGLGVIFRCREEVSVQQFVDANQQLIAAITSKKKLKYALIDLVGMFPMYVAPSEMEKIVQQDRQMAAMLPDGVIVALVAEQNVAYGLARMWEAFVAGINWETQSFRGEDEARAWIRERLKDKFKIELT